MSSVSVIRREIRLKDQHITNHYDKLLIDEKAWTREFSELFRLFRQLKQLDTSEFREAFGELYQPLFDIGYGEGQEGTEDHRLYNEVFDDDDDDDEPGGSEPIDLCEGKNYREVQELVRNRRSGPQEVRLTQSHILLCKWLHGHRIQGSHKGKSYREERHRIYKQFRVFYSDDQDGIYTYRRKAKPEDKRRVCEAILSAMKGFIDVHVRHVRDNMYELTTDGPDKNTSPEMRNLRQMGEDSQFTIRMLSGFDYMGH